MHGVTDDCAFRCVVADPPWAPRDKLPGLTRGAERQYRVMTTPKICEYPLPAINDDAVLFLWRLASMLGDALTVANAWGFRVVSEVVWCKLTKNGKPWFGMGRTVRAAHESCLICLRGRASKVIAAKNVRSVFTAPVPVDAAGKYIHSAKPEKFFDAVVHPLIGGPISGGPCLELFARTHRSDWSALGDELPP